MVTMISEMQGDTGSTAGNQPPYFIVASPILRADFAQEPEEGDLILSPLIDPPHHPYVEVPFGRQSSATWRKSSGENVGTTRYIVRIDQNTISPLGSATVIMTPTDEADTAQSSKEGNFSERFWSDLLIRMGNTLQTPGFADTESTFKWERLNHLAKELSDRWLESIRTEIAAHRTVAISRNFDGLEADLKASFRNEPVEDGFTHAAEDILASALSETPGEPTLEWIHWFSMDTSRPADASSTLRCLARLDEEVPLAWREKFVRDGLGSADLEIRDAAVQAAESWADHVIVVVLKAHLEAQPNEEHWLAEYIEDVISDLSS